MPHVKRIRQKCFCNNVLHKAYLIKFKFENYVEKNKYKKTNIMSIIAE